MSRISFQRPLRKQRSQFPRSRWISRSKGCSDQNRSTSRIETCASSRRARGCEGVDRPALLPQGLAPPPRLVVADAQDRVRPWPPPAEPGPREPGRGLHLEVGRGDALVRVGQELVRPDQHRERFPAARRAVVVDHPVRVPGIADAPAGAGAVHVLDPRDRRLPPALHLADERERLLVLLAGVREDRPDVGRQPAVVGLEHPVQQHPRRAAAGDVQEVAQAALRAPVRVSVAGHGFGFGRRRTGSRAPGFGRWTGS